MDGRSVREAVECESFITELASKNAELDSTADHEWFSLYSVKPQFTTRDSICPLSIVFRYTVAVFISS